MGYKILTQLNNVGFPGLSCSKIAFPLTLNSQDETIHLWLLLLFHPLGQKIMQTTPPLVHITLDLILLCTGAPNNHQESLSDKSMFPLPENPASKDDRQDESPAWGDWTLVLQRGTITFPSAMNRFVWFVDIQHCVTDVSSADGSDSGTTKTHKLTTFWFTLIQMMFVRI